MFILTVRRLNTTNLCVCVCVLDICRFEFFLLDLRGSEYQEVGPDDLQVSSSLNYSEIKTVF